MKTDYIASYNEILTIVQTYRSVDDPVPGKRYPMPQDVFFNIWVRQHELRLRRLALCFSEEPEGMHVSSVSREALLDVALTMFISEPGLVEDRRS